MSGTMHIRFEQDVPFATVEVLAPDHQTVQRMAMEPGTEADIEVPSENSYLRVHLPSGTSVTIPRRQDLDYVVTAADLDRATGMKSRRERLIDPSPSLKSITDVRSYQVQRSAVRVEDPAWLDNIYSGAPAAPQTMSGVHVSWTPEVAPRVSEALDELAYHPPMRETPYRLAVDVTDGASLSVTLPGSLASTYVRADDVGEGGTLITVRVASTDSFANTVGNYLMRGDYYSAETMAKWAVEAEEKLLAKMRDPFTAAVGAYLLLRLEQYDSMHGWAKNLADYFPDISDGCVIWALQVLRQNKDVDQAREYLLMAAERGWPVYMEGTKLLSENLRRLGDEGVAALRNLEAGLGTIIWNTPFTATVTGRSQRDARPISFDIGYESIS